MRIAHLTSVHPRHDTRIFHKMCISIANQGFEVVLIVADGKGDELKKNISILDVGTPKSRLGRMWSAADRVGRAAVLLNADLYHLHDPELMPVGLRLKRLGKRVIFDAHEDLPKQMLGKHYLSKPLRRILSAVLSHYEAYVCNRFDGVIAATPFIKRKFLPINPNSVDICNYPILTELGGAVSWPDKQREVCYVGGLSRSRGITDIVNAMSMCQADIRLNLCGRFESQTYEQELKGLNGWARVSARGHVELNQVQEVISRSVAGLVTLHPLVNYLDALPVKMFEYMSAGIPVIASNFSLWRKIIDGNNCGLLINPLDPEQIAAAVNELVCDPEQARRMGENGRAAVEERYNWESEEKKLLRFYDKILQA